MDTMRAPDSRMYDGTQLADTEHERFVFYNGPQQVYP